MKINLLHPLRY